MSKPLTYSIDEKAGLIRIVSSPYKDCEFIRIEELQKGKSAYYAMLTICRNPQNFGPFTVDLWRTISVARDECIDRGILKDE